MADLLRKTKSLYASTTNTFSTGTGVTITPNSVSGLPTDTEITLTFDRVDSTGAATPTAMERIIGTISGGNFVVRTSPSTGRGADGTSDAAHTSPVVEYIPNAKDSNDLIDAILVEHLQTGAHGNVTASTINVGTTVAFTGGSNEATLSANSAVLIPTQQAVKAYADSTRDPRTTTETSSATPTINTDNIDIHTITAQAEAITSMTTNLSGTPVNGQKLIIRIKDDGTARAITWGASFASRGATLPTTTVLGKYHHIGLIYNSTATIWDCVAAVVEA